MKYGNLRTILILKTLLIKRDIKYSCSKQIFDKNYLIVAKKIKFIY